MAQSEEPPRGFPSREEWLERLGGELLGTEQYFPKSFLRPGKQPEWVQRVEREVARTLLPAAKLRDGEDLTPKRLGALLGHQCAYAVWLTEWVNGIAGD